MTTSLVIILALSLCGTLFADVKRLNLEKPDRLAVVNRSAKFTQQGSRGVLELEGRSAEQRQGIGGEGLAYAPSVQIVEGDIEAELHSGDRFTGLAFRIIDANTYDAVYFRPSSFASSDPKQRAQAIQYVSHPGYSWSRLRFEAPGMFEAAVEPHVAADSWFHVRVRLRNDRVQVFINKAALPSLDVPQLSAAVGGAVGVWVGNGSGGRFAAVAVRPADSASPNSDDASRRTIEMVYKTVNRKPLMLDLHRPRQGSSGPSPLIIYVHGGFWDTDFRKNVPNLFLTRHGYSVASIDYRHFSDAPFPAQLEDVYDAIRYLRAKAADLQIDPGRIAISGDSSGAFLSALAALTAKHARPSEVPELQSVACNVQAVIPYFGRYNLVAMPKENRWLNQGVLGGQQEEREVRLNQWSPVNHISAAAPPFLVIHGEQDTVVPIAETEDFFNKMRQAGADIAFRRVAAGHHWLTFYDTNAAAKAAVLHFLDRTIGQKRVAARAE